MENLVHYRRCHVCDATSKNSDSRVMKCTSCGKSYPKFFYFDDKFLPVQSDFTLRPPLIEGEYKPIYGLTSFWEPF